MSLTAFTCRSCGHPDLEPILSLGSTPLANGLITEDQLREPERTYPLELVFCPRCALVQITETVPPEMLFREYNYLSSFSDTMLQHAERIVERLIALRGLGKKSLVVEIASNDGYLLQYYLRRGIPVLGIEPAVNIARVAQQERGIRTICDFFGIDLARKIREDGEAADVIHANNVLAHVPDINGFVAGIAALLKNDGLAVLEVPYVKDLIDRLEFDTIYHEHLFYFSLTSLEKVVRRHGLVVAGVERLPIHGGSLRVLLAKDDKETNGFDPHWIPSSQLLREEAEWGVSSIAFYRDFGLRVQRLRDQLVAFLQKLKREGKRIAAYGAAAKGATLLNYCGVGKETLDFVVDRSSVKQGRYTPGTRLPIYAPEKLLDFAPDYVLLLAWNLTDEILTQQDEVRRRGGKFIIPIPELRVV